MQVLEKAVRLMKAPAGEGARNRVDSGDIPVTDHLGDGPDDPEFERLEAEFQEMEAELRVPVMPSLIRNRARPLSPELPVDEPAPSAPLFADDRGAQEAGATSPRPQFGPMLTWLGAAASVALIVGISVWTYKLGQRDAMDVPIIAALEGPARIAPADPGGAQVEHQGLAVNAVLDGGGVAAVAPEVTVTAKNEALTDEDAPQALLAAIAAAKKPATRPEPQEEQLLNDNLATVLMIQELEPEPDTGAEIAGSVVEDTTEDDTTEDDMAEDTVVADVVDADPVGPSEEDVADAVAEAVAVAMPDAETEEIDLTIAEAEGPADAEPVVLASLGPVPPRGEGSAHAPAMLVMPRARPADLATEMSAAVDAALAAVLNDVAAPAAIPTQADQASVAPEVAAASDDLSVVPLPEGTRMIQLGAFDSEAVARRQWEQLSGRHGDLLGDKDHYVQKIDRSGRTFYRLRVAGYSNKQETLAACAALTARGLPCMPTVN